MRVIVIDASPINGGGASRAADVAAREAARNGADVKRVRLFDIYAHACHDCHACAGTHRCTKRDERIAEASAMLAAADALLVAAPSQALPGDTAPGALLARLTGSFAGVRLERGLEYDVALPRGRRYAALIVSCSNPMGLPFLLAGSPGLAGTARRTLASTGVRDVGRVVVAEGWGGPRAKDVAKDRARHLGRTLAIAAETTRRHSRRRRRAVLAGRMITTGLR